MSASGSEAYEGYAEYGDHMLALTTIRKNKAVGDDIRPGVRVKFDRPMMTNTLMVSENYIHSRP